MIGDNADWSNRNLTNNSAYACLAWLSRSPITAANTLWVKNLTLFYLNTTLANTVRF